MKNNKIRIKTTDNGRLYYRNIDFFNNKKVQGMIEKMKESSIYKEIEKNKY